MHGALPRALRIVLALILPVAVAAVAVQLHHVNNTTVALTLLTGVLSLALTGEWLEALIAAVASALSLDYFALPPRGFTIREPEQIMAFVAFLFTAIVMGQLFARANRLRDQALRKQAEAEKLNQLSNAIVEYRAANLISEPFADMLSNLLSLDAVALYNKPTGQIYRAGPRSTELISDERLRGAAETGCLDATNGVFVCPLVDGRTVAGTVGLAGANASYSFLTAVTDKIAAAFVHVCGAEKAKEAEIARRSQEYRSALLDALAHEARNSLNSIKLAATNLLSDCSGGSGEQREMLTLIDQETDHMSDWLSETVHLTRAGAGEFTVHKAPHDVRAIILDALENVRPLLQGRAVSVKTADVLPMVDCDASMIQRALQLLLENAVKYSPAGSPVQVSSEQFDDLVAVRVVDAGPGVAEDEQDRVFEKYYRGRQGRSRVPGMGVGLASAKYFVESNGGEIWVTNAVEGGAVFQFSLPSSKRGVTYDELENSHRR